MNNKDREPMEIVIYNIDLTTNTETEIKVEDKNLCFKLEDLLKEINLKQMMSKTYLVVFWIMCAILALGLFLYITKFEFLLNFIIVLGLFNTVNLKKSNDWLELKEKTQLEFNDLVDNNLQKRRKVNE